MELEQLQEKASTALSQLQWDQLVETCKYLKCIKDDNETVKNKSKRALIRLAERELDNIEANQEEGEACQYVQDLLVFIETLLHEDSSKGAEQELTQLKEMKEKYIEMQKLQEESRRGLEEEIKVLRAKLNTMDTVSESTIQPLAPGKVPEVTIRKEFRICGQIGEGGQKDKLSYTNLMHQIDAGLRKGHADQDIIEAVIKAISPGLNLRDMLEIKSDLTLPQLKTILKGHYKEENTSDLYQKLVNISQEPRESAQNFLFRAIELKDRLLFASKENGSDQYNPDLLRRKFLRSVGTGLLSDHIKFQIKPCLDDLTVTDEALIERINEAASLELERQHKLKKNSTVKTTRTNELQMELKDSAIEGHQNVQGTWIPITQPVSSVSGPTQPEKGKKASEKGQMSEAGIHAMVSELKTEMAEMRKMWMASMATETKQGYQRQPGMERGMRKKGCRACQEIGEGENCKHCFRCGKVGHVSRGCRAPRQLQGNGEGLL